MRRINDWVEKVGFIRFIIILFFVGLVLGMLFANLFQSFYMTKFFLFDNSYFVALKTMKVDQLVIFQMALYKYYKDFFMLCLFSTTFIGLPYIVLHDIYKGFCVGFLISTATLRFGIKGILFFLAYITPQYLVFIPLILLTYIKGYGLNQAIYMKTESKRIYLKDYIPFLLVMMVLIALGCLLEGFINAGLMKRIMLLLTE